MAKSWKVVKSPEHTHECSRPSASSVGAGVVIECLECGKQQQAENNPAFGWIWTDCTFVRWACGR